MEVCILPRTLSTAEHAKAKSYDKKKMDAININITINAVNNDEIQLENLYYEFANELFRIQVMRIYWELCYKDSRA